MVGSVANPGELLFALLAFPMLIAGVLKASEALAGYIGLQGVQSVGYGTLCALSLALLPLLLASSLFATLLWGFAACWLISYFYILTPVSTKVPARKLIATATTIASFGTLGILALGFALYEPLVGK